jgi:hypothetical protein
MTAKHTETPLLKESMHAVTDTDFDPPIVALLASDSVYGAHVATFEYAGFGDNDADNHNALDSAEEAQVIAEEIAHRWNAHDDLVKLAELIKKLDEKEGLSPTALGYLRDKAVDAIAKAQGETK